LQDPVISWTSSRDRVEEFVHLLAQMASTLARIGNEIFELQRPEIGELHEPAGPDSVGSITMPHKRNPEMSEHLVTLSRLVRSSAGVILEGAVQEHERDGRSWKAEWVAFPEVCLLTGVALQLAHKILSGLEIDEAAMRRNLSEWGASEKVLAFLGPRLGKHKAQALMQKALAEGRQKNLSPRESLISSDAIRPHLEAPSLESLLDDFDPGAAPLMANEVVARGRRERAQEPDVWP
jgi:adenylosuccinate lyase